MSTILLAFIWLMLNIQQACLWYQRWANKNKRPHEWWGSSFASLPTNARFVTFPLCGVAAAPGPSAASASGRPHLLHLTISVWWIPRPLRPPLLHMQRGRRWRRDWARSPRQYQSGSRPRSNEVPRWRQGAGEEPSVNAQSRRPLVLACLSLSRCLLNDWIRINWVWSHRRLQTGTYVSGLDFEEEE